MSALLRNRGVSFAAIVVVVLSTSYPRLALLGGVPCTDEGIYASAAQLIHDSILSSKGLPDHGVLNIYPLLVSWVFSIDGNHLLLLRVLDMLVAVCAGWLLFGVASRESGNQLAGAAIAAVFSFAMNQQAFVQYGFRNSIFAAYIPLLIALRVGLYHDPREAVNWWMCGALVALAVLLRETLVYFAVLGFLAVLLAHGWRNALRYCFGGVLVAGAVFALVAIARGGLANLVRSYFEVGDMYAVAADMRWQRLQVALETAAIEGAVALPLAVAGIVAVAFASRGGARDTRRWLFWLAVALVPMLEPILKIGYAYHLAVSAIGFCGLASMAWRSLSMQPRSIAMAAASVLLGSSVILGLAQFPKLNAGIAERFANVRAIGERNWPSQSVAQSNYLLLAQAIRNADPEARTLSASGNALVLFPLTGLVPSTHALQHLTDTAVLHGSASLRQAIARCPPDIVMLTARPQKVAGREAILEALSAMPEYSEGPDVRVARYEDFKASPGGRGVEHAPSGSLYRRNPKNAQCDARDG